MTRSSDAYSAEERRTLRQMWQAGHRDHVIGQALNRHPESVRAQRRALGLSGTRGRPKKNIHHEPRQKLVIDDERLLFSRLRDQCYGWGDKTKFAKRVGVTPCFISHILSGKEKPSARIAEALGVGMRVVSELDQETANG